MRAEQALDEMALLRMKLTQPRMRGITQGWFEALRDATGYQYLDADIHYADYELARLKMAEAFFISRDMCSLLVHAANLLDDTDCYVRDLWPTDFGWVWFDGGITMVDRQGQTMVLSAATWGRTSDTRGRNGMAVTLYSDVRDTRDEISVLMQQQMENWQEVEHLAPSHLLWAAEGQRVGPCQDSISIHTWPRWRSG